MKVAVIAAHPDDEALGCGGTLLKLKNLGAEIHLMFLTDGCGARSDPNTELRSAGLEQALSFIEPFSVKTLSLPDNQLDTVPLLGIIREIESFLRLTAPKIVFTHSDNDLNIDHCITNRSTLTASRPGNIDSIEQIYAFEVPSSTEWAFNRKNFSPDTFINISDHMNLKLEYLACYKEELRDFPNPRSYENVKAMNQFRGACVCVPYAEGFQTIRRNEIF